MYIIMSWLDITPTGTKMALSSQKMVPSIKVSLEHKILWYDNCFNRLLQHTKHPYQLAINFDEW